MKRVHTKRVISEDEQIARYAHVLGNVPTAVADRAYAAAYQRLTQAQREQIVSGLRDLLPASAIGTTPHDCEAFATLMRSLHARLAIVTAPGAAVLAAAFVASPPIVAYFTTGAGSVGIDEQPPWLHELAGHETAPKDAGWPSRFGGLERWG